MAKLSHAVKETIQTIVFILVVALLIVTYVVYPLNRTKAMMGRLDLDEFNEDTVLVNDPTYFIEAGLPADSFMFEADALTNLACLSITPDSSTATAILLAPDNMSRDSLLPLISELNENHINVVTYDQRATGLSTGKFRGEGQLEAKDLLALISTLEIREKIVHPLIVVGFETGADAALLANLEESRIQQVIAVNPYLTTKRMQTIHLDNYDTFWFPFSKTVLWWWYNMRSGYAENYRESELIQAVASPTLIIADQKYQNDEEISLFTEISDNQLLTIDYLSDASDINSRIIEYFKNNAN